MMNRILLLSDIHIARGGPSHFADLGDQARLPKRLDWVFRGWLAECHVVPRDRLVTSPWGVKVAHTQLLRGYAQKPCITKP